MNDFFSHVDDFFSGSVPGLLDRGVGREKDLYYEVILTQRGYRRRSFPFDG